MAVCMVMCRFLYSYWNNKKESARRRRRYEKAGRVGALMKIVIFIIPHIDTVMVCMHCKRLNICLLLTVVKLLLLVGVAAWGVALHVVCAVFGGEGVKTLVKYLLKGVISSLWRK